jgi:hypothetical protein
MLGGIAMMRQTSGVEPVAAVAIVASSVGIALFAARQAAAGRRRFAWVFLALPILGLVYVLLIAIRNWADQPMMALVLGVIAVPSLILTVRSARHQASGPLLSDPTWKLSSAEFDSIVWMALGIPLLAVIGLIALLVAYALGAFN